MTLPIVAALGIVLGWYLVVNYEAALRAGTSTAFGTAQLEIARTLARSAEDFARDKSGLLSVQAIEAGIRERFTAPVRLFGGGAWLFSPGRSDCGRDSLLPWCPGGESDGNAAGDPVAAPGDEDAAAGMERLLAAVSSGREGMGRFFSPGWNRQELIAWTPVSVDGASLVVGVTTSFPDVLEATGVVRQSRNAMVMVGLMTIGGLGLIIVSTKNIVSRRRAEIELERANAELEERVARRTEELQARTRALMESRMRERLREKEAEIAFQAGLVESAGTYLHTTGNSLTALEGLFLKMRRILDAAARADQAFADARDAVAQALGREESPAAESLAALETALLGRAVPRLAETLTEMGELKTRMIAELDGRRVLFDASRSERRFTQAVDLGELLREMADEAREELAGRGLGLEVGDVSRLVAQTSKRKLLLGLSRCLAMIREAARPGRAGEVRLFAGHGEDGRVRVVMRASGAAFVGADPGRDDPGLLSFINFLNENHGMFGIVHDAEGFSVEVELCDSPAGA
ncbi:hypothetical protein [Desulfolutivibrio sulfoxidireducens]|uniref:hypothetical protein n=1 Tax=Desulfolutivibrio sulfoxidireducens TaxID=2773299 RepID=UPI00159D3F65|nr:hypothetical protein [Desulfolutivibrio sulfoxidireducens]QLA20662.1 hypothetical protein GD604_13555 [Desulfolutivibrio sulfoxidireducens]